MRASRRNSAGVMHSNCFIFRLRPEREVAVASAMSPILASGSERWLSINDTTRFMKASSAVESEGEGGGTAGWGDVSTWERVEEDGVFEALA